MCGRGSCDGSCLRADDTHDHRCAACGHWFECLAGWTREMDADGRMRDVRACDDTAVCEDCAKAADDGIPCADCGADAQTSCACDSSRDWDAHDAACHRADLAHHDGNC